jgi:hypothetical protein
VDEKVEARNTIENNNAQISKPHQAGASKEEFDFANISRIRIHSFKKAELTGLVDNIKRKCTIDISNKVEKDLVIEHDEVSQKLLQKLTTPKQPSRLMSFSFSNIHHTAHKLEFNSDIDSYIEDDFEKRSSCGFP